MRTLAAIALLAHAVVACGGQQSVATDEETEAYVEAMTTEHAGEVPTATPMADATDAADVVTERVVYLDFAPGYPGYLARPAGTPRGGIVLVHEWWGLNENIEGVAERLAAEGYATLAVDLYAGVVATDAELARELMSTVSNMGGVATNHVSAGAEWLRANTGVEHVAAMGFCFGGAVTLQSLIGRPESVDAGVIYYGRLTDDADEIGQIDDPVLGIFGALDNGIPLESVRAFESAATAAGVELELHVFEGAEHAFANPSGERYNAEAAEAAWTITLAFLDRVMGAAD